MAVLKRYLVVKRGAGTLLNRALALHAVDEASHGRFQQLIDLSRAAVAEDIHQAQLGQGLGERLASVLQRLRLSGCLVDHSIVLLGLCSACVETALRTEAVVGKAVPAQMVEVAETAL